ncbi:MAG TPA: 4-alpha-glucanotransferase [Xanthobacteraceae bacterium]|nr:4-alpha-glucanotransferase [Xanthobacteraceae bacterium]
MQGLAARAAELGIETEYVDARGVRRAVPKIALDRLVAALQLPDSKAGKSVRTFVWRQGRTRSLEVGEILNAGEWRLLSAKKQAAEASVADGWLTLSGDVPVGVYGLAPAAGTKTKKTTKVVANLIVAPETAYQLEDVAQDRIWVLAVQLYGVRSHRNWGHGDFTDLKQLVRLAARAGAAGIGLNPLHALFDDRPDDASPYAPNSRLFLNPLYIDAEAIAEFPGLEACGLGREIERLRASELVDYAAVAAAKAVALRAAYDRFRAGADPQRQAEFAAFRRERGEALMRFAAFEVLRRKFLQVWWEWPREWRRPSGAAVERLRAEAGEEMGFYEFLQWIADRQLAACQQEARALGLPIGLYIDLAVGVEPGGADAWSAQQSMVQQVEVGAPPDMLNTAGQAWGLAAFNPTALEAAAFAPFGELLAAAMRHAGAIRLDHVLGLNRLYLIPFGCNPQDGAYVRYPLEALLAMVALESAERRCLVIGEDLGTVPENLRGILADWGIWSYLVMLFERREDAAFKPAPEYRRNALVTFSTHDLPTFSGWRGGHDLAVKRNIGIDPGESDEDRARAHWLVGEALSHSGISRDREWLYADILRFLARTPSRLLVVAVEDLLAVTDQPNIPGTRDEHPNWRRRLPVALEQLAQHEGLRAAAAVLREEGRSLPSISI